MYNREELNDIQKQAVLETEGAVLVTAGAGSGKTRLLTHRIVHLIKDLRVPPYNILAITFTNKAANEMRTRLDSMIDAEGLWISTFHSACVRILRHFIDKIGFSKNFTIYGDAETKAVIKRICKDYGYNDEMQKRIAVEISNAKNKGITPDDYEAVYKFSGDAEDVAKAYDGYQKALKANNALDYDDLLIVTLRLLKTSAEAREYYQNKFKYIHIDEFQDTNVIQYEIAKILAGKYGNIFAVGDEDQCIYSWRGASIANIFDFQKDFHCKVFKLEQNYRSTTNILTVANRIIKGNTQRLDKRLWTANTDGEKVVCFGAATEGFEADYVVKTIYELIENEGYNYSDFAVLMRLNALSRPFEERFLQYGIPHRVYGGFKFFDRKEVKDVLAYARVSVNTKDDEAALRIINFPRRGIGEASVEKLRRYAFENGISIFDAVTDADGLPPSFGSALINKLKGFGETLVSLNRAANGDVIEYFRYLLYGVLNAPDLFSEDDGETRLENLNELISSVRDFAKNNEGAGLSDYLQMISLYSDTDEMTGDDTVTIATVHSAKGLEFPVVFVVGLEEGIFPSIRVNESGANRMEEERRLMYVAVTRARERLYLTYAKSRFLYGDTKYNIPSRFLVECDLTERQQSFLSQPYYEREKSEKPVKKEIMPEKTFDSKFDGAYKSDYGKQKPTENSDVGAGNIKIGATVMHKKFGKGKVIGLDDMGDNSYAKIDFERGGVMLLAVRFAPLTVVED